MFKEWDFLLVEIWGLLALAALVGLVAGWLLFGRRSMPDNGFAEDEIRRLRAELDRANAARRSSIVDDIPPMQGGGYVRPSARAAAQDAAQSGAGDTEVPDAAPIAPKAPAIAVDPVQAPAAAPEPALPADPDRPTGLSAPRDGLPDDLTKIKGVGKKLEKLCNDLGVWHYDQIAGWTEEEIAWVDENLEGFKGRVTRDGWVEQAKALARNETPAFVRRDT